MPYVFKDLRKKLKANSKQKATHNTKTKLKSSTTDGLDRNIRKTSRKRKTITKQSKANETYIAVKKQKVEILNDMKKIVEISANNDVTPSSYNFTEDDASQKNVHIVVAPSNDRPNSRISLKGTKCVFYNIEDIQISSDDDDDEGLKLIIVDLDDN